MQSWQPDHCTEKPAYSVQRQFAATRSSSRAARHDAWSCLTTPVDAALQALLKTAVDNALEAWRSGAVGDLLTLALNRAARTGTASLLDALREQQQRHSASQQDSATPGDPTTDADGVTDSQACLHLSALCAVSELGRG